MNEIKFEKFINGLLLNRWESQMLNHFGAPFYDYESGYTISINILMDICFTKTQIENINRFLNQFQYTKDDIFKEVTTDKLYSIIFNQ